MNIIEKTYSLNGGLQTRSKTARIILHHAASTNCTADDIDRWHKGNDWTCIGYHFFVNKKGEVYRGRKEDTVGAHAGNNNSDSIGICAEGNFENETMPEAQKQSLKELVAYLKNKYGISKVQRHKDVNATACPGKNYPFDEIANATVKPAESKPVETVTEGYLVKVNTECLNIRDGAGTDNNLVGQIKDRGTYTIVAEANGKGANKWGKLKSGAGWIALDYTIKQTSGIVSTKKSIDEIAKEVIRGEWGNGQERKDRLTKAGYDYNAVQKRVNQML